MVLVAQGCKRSGSTPSWVDGAGSARFKDPRELTSNWDKVINQSDANFCLEIVPRQEDTNWKVVGLNSGASNRLFYSINL